MKITLYYLICLLVLAVCPVLGQTVANETETVRTALVTQSGKIAVYFSDTKNSSNCIIHRIDTGEKINLRNVDSRMLVTDQKGVFYSYSKQELYLLDINSKKTDTILEVSGLEIIEPLSTVVYRSESKKQLVLLNLKTGVSESIADVLFYSVDIQLQKLVFQTKENELFTRNLKIGNNVQYDEVDLKGITLKLVTWDVTGKFAYVFGVDDDSMYLYELSDKMKEIGVYPIRNHKENLVIDTFFSSVKVLPNNHIAIGVKPLEIKKENGADVEVWNGTKKGFPAAVNFHRKYVNQLAIIDGSTGKFTSLLESGKVMGYKVDHLGNLFRYELLENDDTSLSNPPINLYKYDFKMNTFNYFNRFSSVSSNLLDYKAFPHLVYYKDNHWHYFDEKVGRGVNRQHNLDLND